MAVSFKPDRYGVQVISKWTSNSGRWILALGTHWRGKFQCWDLVCFNTTHGACQRLHVNTKEEAMVLYDTTKEKLSKLKPHDEPANRYQIFGPDGRPSN